MIRQSTKIVNQLYHSTKAIYEQCQFIDHDMDQNDLGKIETLQQLLDVRGQMIKELDSIYRDTSPEWSVVERAQIKQMKEWEQISQPKLNRVFQAFTNQMDKFQQGRKLTNYYQEKVEITYTEGAYFDKRK